MVNHPSSNPSRVRMQHRDIAVLNWLVEGRVSTLEAVQGRLLVHDRTANPTATPLSMRAVRQVVDRWIRAGLVTLQGNPWGGNGIVVAQRPALGLVNASLSLRTGMGDLRSLRHSLAVQSIGVELMHHGFEWTHEVWLPWNDGHRPDGYARKSDEAFAVEVDLSRKQRERWLRIARLNIQRYEFVNYFTTRKLAKSLWDWATDAGIDQVCNVHTLPTSISQEVNVHVA